MQPWWSCRGVACFGRLAMRDTILAFDLGRCKSVAGKPKMQAISA
jgi:hypothetical protein